MSQMVHNGGSSTIEGSSTDRARRGAPPTSGERFARRALKYCNCSIASLTILAAVNRSKSMTIK
jgi:hypothetical protein